MEKPSSLKPAEGWNSKSSSTGRGGNTSIKSRKCRRTSTTWLQKRPIRKAGKGASMRGETFFSYEKQFPSGMRVIPQTRPTTIKQGKLLSPSLPRAGSALRHACRRGLPVKTRAAGTKKAVITGTGSVSSPITHQATEKKKEKRGNDGGAFLQFCRQRVGLRMDKDGGKTGASNVDMALIKFQLVRK